MLKFLSRRKRSRKVLLLVFVALLALGLIGVFTPAWTGLRGAANDDTVVAEVGNQEVTVAELRAALSGKARELAIGQGTSRMNDPATVYALYGQEVLDNLIRQKLVLYEAEKLSLASTDQEVQDRIKRLFNPWPGYEQYRRVLREQINMTPAQYEANLRSAITMEKVRSFITAAVQVSPQEIEDEYRRNNTNYSVRWVELTPEQFRDKVQVNDAELRAYFDQRKPEFRINSEQRRARYIFVDQNKAGESIQVSDEEMKENYNPAAANMRLRVSQIVLNIPKDKAAPAPPPDPNAAQTNSQEQEVQKKAEQIVERAKGQEGKPAEDFAALVRQYSEDSKSKAKGGDVGWFDKNKIKTDDPVNNVFTTGMGQGDVSAPVRKGDQVYVFKVTDRELPTFEQSREQLLKEARARKGYSKAVEIATEAEQKFKETKNPEAVVAEINGKYGAQVATLKETPYFTEDDSNPDQGLVTSLVGGVFDLGNVGDITERLNVNNGFAIAQFVEKKDPHDPAFEEVRSKVEERFRIDKAKELAAERARQLAQATSIEGLKTGADASGLKTEEKSNFTITDSIGALLTETSRQPIYNLKTGEITRTPIKAENSDNYVVAGMINRKDADMGEAFQKLRTSIEERLLDVKRNAFFEAHLAATQRRLQEKGDIEIYQNVIAETVGSAPPGGLPQQPGIPNMPGRDPMTRTITPRRTPQGVVPGPPPSTAPQQ